MYDLLKASSSHLALSGDGYDYRASFFTLPDGAGRPFTISLATVETFAIGVGSYPYRAGPAPGGQYESPLCQGRPGYVGPLGPHSEAGRAWRLPLCPQPDDHGCLLHSFG